MVNGLGNGCCGICHYGLLPGWSGDDQTCGYAHCGKAAVARAPRVGFACADHLERAGVAAKVRRALEQRPRHWKEVED